MVLMPPGWPSEWQTNTAQIAHSRAGKSRLSLLVRARLWGTTPLLWRIVEAWEQYGLKRFQIVPAELPSKQLIPHWAQNCSKYARVPGPNRIRPAAGETLDGSQDAVRGRVRPSFSYFGFALNFFRR